MYRIIKLTNKSEIMIGINKYDMNVEKSEEIAVDYIKFLGKNHFNKEEVKSINDGSTIVNINSKSGEAIKDIFGKNIYILTNKL